MCLKRPPISLRISSMLKICEIFKSIQGESSRAGQICAFIRLHGCNLNCSFCDTEYARTGEFEEYSIDEAVAAVNGFDSDLVEVTGGEPLIQKDTPALCKTLLDCGRTVLVETNGTKNIALLPVGCIRIIDVKCPGSNAGGSFLMDNVPKLTATDEMKFVVTNRDDFEWALDFCRTHEIFSRCAVYMSPAYGIIQPEVLAQWILESDRPVRMGLQLHKIIWGNRRGA